MQHSDRMLQCTGLCSKSKSLPSDFGMGSDGIPIPFLTAHHAHTMDGHFIADSSCSATWIGLCVSLLLQQKQHKVLTAPRLAACSPARLKSSPQHDQTCFTLQNAAATHISLCLQRKGQKLPRLAAAPVLHGSTCFTVSLSSGWSSMKRRVDCRQTQ